MSNHYEIPSWAGKPPVGLHLDVRKADNLVQKLMIDEKKCYLFGRNRDLNDICIDHASCSRVHAALVYHRHLNRNFLVDLGSTHGTFIGSLRLESNKPTQLPVDSTFHFGASTRFYVLRERPQSDTKSSAKKWEKKIEELEEDLLGFPENEKERDNITEFNTAYNRRISAVGIGEEEIKPTCRNKKTLSVRFSRDDDIINPEDVDPSVGKFRNMVQTAVIPNKRKLEESENLFGSGLTSSVPKKRKTSPCSSSNDKSCSEVKQYASGLINTPLLSSKLDLHLPNPAPDVDLEHPVITPDYTTAAHVNLSCENNFLCELKKKKYAKEAWPGKKSAPSLLG